MENNKQNEENINNLNNDDISALFGQKNVEKLEENDKNDNVETNKADKVAKLLDNTEIDYEKLKKDEESKVYDANHPTLNNIAKSLVEESKSTELNVNVVNPATIGNLDMIEKIVDSESKKESEEVSKYKAISPRIYLEKTTEEKKEEENRVELKPDPISKAESVKILEPNDEIVRIRETEDSIENYEKTLEEEEFEKSIKETEVESEKYEKLKEAIEKDFSDEATDENSQVKIVVESEETKKEDEEQEKDEIKIKYLGGDPKNKKGWPFVEKPNTWAKKYMNLPKESIPDNIVGEDLVLDDSTLSEYIVQKNRFNSMVKTKVALPFSGMTIYVRSYKNSTFTQVIDALARWDAQRRYILSSEEDIENANFILSEAYYKLRKTELESIYKHIDSVYLVNKGLIEKPEMNELFKMIKYPDLQQLYFAVYHGTNANKRKKYRITCHNPIKDEETGAEVACGFTNTLELYDEELVFGIVNENLSENDFYLLISDAYPKDRTLGITKLAKKEIHRLTSTKTNIVQHVPSVWDYLETMSLMLEIIKDPEIDIDIDLTNIDVEIPDDEWDYQMYDKVKLLKTYLYTKQIDFLWLLNSATDEVRYKTVSVEKNKRREIFDILIDLPFDDMLSLTRGKEIKEMMALKALDYYVPEFKCKKCGKKINPVKFDIRTNFFIQLSEMRKTKG